MINPILCFHQFQNVERNCSEEAFFVRGAWVQQRFRNTVCASGRILRLNTNELLFLSIQEKPKNYENVLMAHSDANILRQNVFEK